MNVSLQSCPLNLFCIDGIWWNDWNNTHWQASEDLRSEGSAEVAHLVQQLAPVMDTPGQGLWKNKATGWLGALVRVTNLIFEAKRQNAGICRSRQKMFATWTFISIGRRVTQKWKFAFRLRGDSILLFKGQKKTLEIYDFQSSESYQGDIHSSSFFLFSTLAVPERLWQTQKPQSATRQQCDAMSSCRPKCTFFCARFAFLWSIDGGRHFLKCFHVPSICWVPATMVSIGFIPQNDLENDKS